MSFSVVIPTHNRSAKLALTLDHLAAQSVSTGWDVLVVANRCTDDTVRSVGNRSDSFPVPLRVMEEPRAGAAAARNTGARTVRGSDVLFLDDDILVQPDCIARLSTARSQHAQAWIVGQVLPLPCHVNTPFGAFRAAFMPETPETDPVTEVTWFASGIALVPTARLLALGGYEEDFPGAALEDVDLAIRAVRAGNPILYDPRIKAVHNDSAGTSLRDFCRRQRLYYRTAPMITRRFGSEGHFFADLIAANSRPVWRQDSLVVIARKLLKRLVGTQALQFAIIEGAELLEEINAPPKVLWPLYRSAIAGSMYGAYQEGCRNIAARQHADPL